MQSIIILSMIVAGCLCSAGWGSQGQDGSQSRGIPRQVNSGGWGGVGGRGFGGPEGGWGGQQGRQSGWGGNQGLQGQPGAWRQGAGGWRSGRSTDDGQYGATIIDTPDMYGYEASIPGAQSRFVGYRSARSGSGGLSGGLGQGLGNDGGYGVSSQGRQY